MELYDKNIEINTAAFVEKKDSVVLPSTVISRLILPETTFATLENRFGDNGVDKLRQQFANGHEFAFWHGAVPETVVNSCLEEADRLKVLFLKTFFVAVLMNSSALVDHFLNFKFSSNCVSLLLVNYNFCLAFSLFLPSSV